MCGIYGFIRTQKEIIHDVLPFENTLKAITYFTRLRGIDALGTFKVDKEGDCDFIKDVGEPTKILESKDFSTFCKWPGDNRAMVFHNRHATRGKKDDVTHAHPFWYQKYNKKGEIALVHNGTVSHINDGQKWPGATDSQQIASMIASGMPLDEFTGRCWGAWALVWYDSEENTMNFLRNKERPFGFVYSDKTLWFGSEVYMIAAGMDRSNISAIKLERFPENQHWAYHLDDFKFEKKEIKAKEYPKSYSPSQTQMSYGYPQRGYGWDEYDDYGIGKQYEIQVPKSESKALEVQPFKEIKDPLSASTQPIISKSIVSSYRGSSKRGVGKPRWGQVNDYSGLVRGDSLTFNLTDYKSTKQPGQVAMNGTLVTFYEDNKPARCPLIKIEGMVSMNIELVDASTKLWTGIITNIMMRAKEHEHDVDEYLIYVKDIQQCSLPDPFLDQLILQVKKMLPPVKENEKETPAPSLQVPLPQSTQKEEKTSEGFVNVLKCSDCGTFVPKENTHKMTFSLNADSPIHLRLCGPCFKEAINNPDRPKKIAEKIFMDDDPLLMDRHATPQTVH